MLRNKIIFTLVGAGIVAAFGSAYVYAVPSKAQPPAFQPASNPYASGIYANGIVESDQSNGENVNIDPEVAGVVTQIAVKEGEHVSKGAVLFTIDDAVQRATVEQLRAQADAAGTLLEELQSQPRKESLEVAKAQMELAQATLKGARDSLDKLINASDVVSKDVLDTAKNTVNIDEAALDVAARQYELVHAGAWRFDIENQRKQAAALSKAVAAASALLDKYTVRAPADGVVLSIRGAVGTYVSPQGAYDTYTQAFLPVMTLGSGAASLAVRCYIDEILIPHLPPVDKLQAKATVRGTDVSIPLEFVRVQPYVSPKIQLSAERLERVDVRVLPIVFRFQPPKGMAVFPGQMVDVYIGQ